MDAKKKSEEPDTKRSLPRLDIRISLLARNGLMSAVCNGGRHHHEPFVHISDHISGKRQKIISTVGGEHFERDWLKGCTKSNLGVFGATAGTMARKM